MKRVTNAYLTRRRRPVLLLGAGDVVITTANGIATHRRIIDAWSGGTTAGAISKAAFTPEAGLVDGMVEWEVVSPALARRAQRQGRQVLDLASTPPRLWSGRGE